MKHHDTPENQRQILDQLEDITLKETIVPMRAYFWVWQWKPEDNGIMFTMYKKKTTASKLEFYAQWYKYPWKMNVKWHFQWTTAEQEN